MKSEDDFLERHWKKIVAALYIGLLLSLGVIGFQLADAPMKEEFVEDDSVVVWVHNKRDHSLNLTVKMIGVSQIDEMHQNKITDFGTKEVWASDKVRFETSISSSYQNYPFEIRVFRSNDTDEPLVKKEVSVTVGYKTGNENVFNVEIPPKP